MNLFRLIYIFIFIFSFSGKPVSAGRPPVKLEVPKTVRIEDEVSVPWLPQRKLTWEDFLCDPLRNSDAVASTNTLLGITYKVQGTQWFYQITCNFSKPKSWGLLRTDYILAHEQAHFDITELFARRLYEALQKYQFNPRSYKTDIAAIYQKIVKEKEEMQETYDRETDHSRNRKVQFQWLGRIDDMLTASAPYAEYP